MRTVILAAGHLLDHHRIKAAIGVPDLVICADGGVRHAEPLGLTPDLILGDFDSAGSELVEGMSQQGIPVLRVPAEKDETDTHLAMEEAVRRGASEIILIGGTGDRLDHTVANLLLLPGVPDAVPVTVMDAKNTIRLLRPGGRMTVSREPGAYLSLLPLTPEVTGVRADGVKWPLNEATLRWGASLGVSNVVVDPEAQVAIRDGYLLVIQARD